MHPELLCAMPRVASAGIAKRNPFVLQCHEGPISRFVRSKPYPFRDASAHSAGSGLGEPVPATGITEDTTGDDADVGCSCR